MNEELETAIEIVERQGTIKLEVIADRPGYNAHPLLVRVNSVLQAEIAHIMAMYFKRESHYDAAQCTPSDLNENDGRIAYLITDKEYQVGYAVACGALVVVTGERIPRIDWVWLHPYVRGLGLWTAVWEELAARHPGLAVTMPLSKAMKHIVTSRGIPAVS